MFPDVVSYLPSLTSLLAFFSLVALSGSDRFVDGGWVQGGVETKIRMEMVLSTLSCLLTYLCMFVTSPVQSTHKSSDYLMISLLHCTESTVLTCCFTFVLCVLTYVSTPLAFLYITSEWKLCSGLQNWELKVVGSYSFAGTVIVDISFLKRIK